MDEKLITFIERSMDRGYSIDYIRKALLDAGHSIMAVEEHIGHFLKSRQNEKLRDFIKRHAEMGSDMDKVKQALQKAGHDIKIVEEYISQAIDNRAAKKQWIRKHAAISLIGLAAVIILIAAWHYFADYQKTDLAVNQAQPAEANYQKNLDVLNKALISGDGVICEEIEYNDLKDECKNKFKRNISGRAYNKTDDGFESKELLNKALINHNASLCIEIKDEAIKKQCGQIFKR